MRKEIVGILFFFLILFAAGSLISFSPNDPSILASGPVEHIRNFFGVIGSQFAGLLIFFLGLGAFWVPVMMFYAARHIARRDPWTKWFPTTAGGFVLMVCTGSLLALFGEDYFLFGSKFSSGGVFGMGLSDLLVNWANFTGAAAILLTCFVVSFILATHISMIQLAKYVWALWAKVLAKAKVRVEMWKSRRTKKKNLAQVVRIKKSKPQVQPKIKKPKLPPVKKTAANPQQQVFEFMKNGGDYELPPLSILDTPEHKSGGVDSKTLEVQSGLVEKKLEDFGITGRVSEVCPGPVITTFEYEPGPGIKITRIANLSDDLAMALRAASVRIVAPIPGKAAVGIEIPNAEREMVFFSEMVGSEAFSKSRSKLTVCLGKDIEGVPVVADLAKMPHLLIAGATGAGKSVGLNSMISSILYKAKPEEVRFIMVDPKRIELSIYDGIPHLITPVVTDVKKATNALFWAVREMERRYEAMASVGARNINGYNQKIAVLQKKQAPAPELSEDETSDTPQTPALEKIPYVIVVIDELADLMMVSSRDVEVALARLAQMARAAGIHMILATQRPSVDVLTGTIKANFPTRIAYQVSSRIDSRTILDSNGAENLLGNGDMLFLPPGAAKLQRLHGAFLSDDELNRLLEVVRAQKAPEYDESITQAPVAKEADSQEEDYDEKYDQAVAFVTESKQASISMVQRKLRIGYNRAARIIEMMEKEGIVGPADGARPREVLVRGYDD